MHTYMSADNMYETTVIAQVEFSVSDENKVSGTTLLWLCELDVLELTEPINYSNILLITTPCWAFKSSQRLPVCPILNTTQDSNR